MVNKKTQDQMERDLPILEVSWLPQTDLGECPIHMILEILETVLELVCKALSASHKSKGILLMEEFWFTKIQQLQ